MSVLTAPRTYTGLAAFQAADAVACAVPAPFVTAALDRVGCPPAVRRVLPVVKAASAVGLLGAGRFPTLARVTTAALTLYFTLAVAAHLRVRDRLVDTAPAVSLLTVFAVLTAAGPRPAQTSEE